MSRSKDRALKSAKDARGNENYLPLTINVLRSKTLSKLSPYGCKLLLDIASQLTFERNGDASTAFEKVLRQRGWKSKSTLQKAINELLDSGLVVKTRQGGLHQCSLYGLAWLAISECGGKLEMKPTRFPITSRFDPYLPYNKFASTPRVPKMNDNSILGSPRVLDG